MKTNESALDRIIRGIVGIALIALYFTGTVTGALGIILLVIDAVLLLTGIFGFCPLYKLLNISTNKA
jgi:hypothetical protein